MLQDFVRSVRGNPNAHYNEVGSPYAQKSKAMRVFGSLDPDSSH